MPKIRLSSPPKQQTPVMSTPHTYTVGGGASSLSQNDDDDNDICPVCDGECTCDNRPRPPPSSIVVRPAGSHAHPPPPAQPSLKIKLTVPPGVLGRKPDPKPKKSKNISTGNECGTSYSTQISPAPAPKRRGRPPKVGRETTAAVDRGPDVKKDARNTFSGPSKTSSLKRGAALPQTSGRPKIKPQGVVKSKGRIPPDSKKRVSSNNPESDQTAENDSSADEDARSTKFPTFISASAIGSSDSNESDSSSSSSGCDTDSSIEAEEENFIISDEKRAHDKARVRRELLGRNDPPKKRDSRNDWIIQPRKKSVDSSDVEMEGEGESEDVTEDEEEDEAVCDNDDEPDDRGPGGGYAGVATSWSESEESRFDADLFFANLSDSQESSHANEDDDPSNQGQISLTIAAATGLLPHDTPRREMGDLMFEVTEGWDGYASFSDGLRVGQGVLDIDFEVNATQLVVEASPSICHDSEADVRMTDGEDGEYDEEEFELEAADGETTEEELVDKNGLPTERAMKLFRFPPSVSAINPMSTLSPSTSPPPRNRRRPKYPDSPRPADILAGKVFDLDDMGDGEGAIGGTRIPVSRSGLPSMGHFEPVPNTPQRGAIIDGSQKDIPSPYRRRPRGRSTSSFGSSSRGRSRAMSRPSSLSESTRSLFQIMSSEELLTSTSADFPPTEPIDIDDVLDASLLDTDASDIHEVLTNASPEVDARKHLRDLSRWDVVSVGAFRQTLETSGSNDNPSGSWDVDVTPPYENAMKTNTFDAMMCDDKTPPPSGQPRNRRSACGKVSVSPTLQPVREGDHTSTDSSPDRIPQPPPVHHAHRHNAYQKTRKELKKEKKLRRKNYGPVNQHHQHHHQHQHHPNMKTRSSSSAQRANFSSPASCIPTLNV